MRRLFLGTVLAASLLFVVATSGEEARKADGPCGEASSVEQDTKSHGLPCVCPLWEADYLPDNTVLYYCDRFESGDVGCANPFPAYAIGNYTWPVNAPPCHVDCIDATHGGKSTKADAAQSKKFPGLSTAKDHDFVPFLLGPAGRFSKVEYASNIGYLKLPTKTTGDIFAKVIRYEVDIDKALGDEINSIERTFYVAFETVSAPPVTEGVQQGLTHFVVKGNSMEAPPHYAYYVIYRSAKILVLTKTELK
jgi:hypothetical protein